MCERRHLFHPGDKGCLKRLRIEHRHHPRYRVIDRDGVAKHPLIAKSLLVRTTELFDIQPFFGPADRGVNAQHHDVAQAVHHFARLARVANNRQMSL